MTRRKGTLLMLAASTAALIATSKEVPPAQVASVTLEEALDLDAGESVTYSVQVSHGLAADADAFLSVYAEANVYASPEDSTLSIYFHGDEDADTGSMGLRTNSLVLVSGTQVSDSESYLVDATPVVTLTAGEAGGISGALTVAVTLTLDEARDSGERIGELTAELVEVAE